MMRLRTLAVGAMAIGLLLAGNAQAGYIDATYSLAGSTITVTNPLGSASDPITGQVTFRYWVASPSAPITGAPASLLGGNTQTIIGQTFPAGITLTGVSNQVMTGESLLMGAGGSAVMLGTAAASQTGTIHCTGGLCGLAGFPASVTIPQSSNNPFFIPTMLFTSGQAGVGNWTAAALTGTAGGGAATTTIQYVGTEISRAFVPEPGTASLVYLGLAGMAGASSYMRRRRNR